jgi:type I restriction enzyme S subunit
MEVRPGYKQTEVGVIPEEWEVKPLGDLSQTSSGTTPARALQDRYYKNGTIGWVKTLDLRNTELLATSECITELALKETCLRIYPNGTVLVAMYGGFQQIGRTGLLRFPAAVNQAITAIQPKGEALSSEYLLATLNYRIGYWKNVASSSRKDPNISSHDIRAFPVAHPPLLEQRAIAEALGDVDSLLAALDRLIAKKRDLKQAAMQQLLTGRTRLPGFSGEWEVKTFAAVLVRLNAKAHQIQTSDYQSSGRFPVVDQGKEAVISFSDMEDKRLRCPEGGVIVFGDHTCIVKFIDCDFLVGADGTQVLEARTGQSTRFHALQLQYRGIEPTGYNRHFKFLKEREFISPLLPEQTAIAEVLTDMDRELAALEQRRAKTCCLKQAMMQELLTGRIRLV